MCCDARGKTFAKNAMFLGARTEDSESWSFLLLENGCQHVPVVATLDETTDNQAEEQRLDCDHTALH